jgi:hypothetical protein
MHPFHYLLAAFGVLVLVSLVFAVRWERRYFAAIGKGGPWRTMRLTTIPLLAVTAAMILVPTLAIAGMEALAAFYLMLLIVAPLFWFGVHWLIGRRTQPRLDPGEIILIAGAPIGFVIAAAGVAHALQPWAWRALRSFGLV